VHAPQSNTLKTFSDRYVAARRPQQFSRSVRTTQRPTPEATPSPPPWHLPQLRRFRLRGKFYLDGDSEIGFEYAGMESRKIAPYRDALENFILEGGEYPMDDEEILPDQADDPDEIYRRPGLPQDNTELDDPMVHYNSDESDTRI
jgi:hypothetical protein